VPAESNFHPAFAAGIMVRTRHWPLFGRKLFVQTLRGCWVLLKFDKQYESRRIAATQFMTTSQASL
jgi:hypothetical protein